MIFDVPPPPKLWLPEKPAIVRAASLKDIAPANFGCPMFVGANKQDPIVTYLGGAAFEYNASSYSNTFSLDTAQAGRVIVAIFNCNNLTTNYSGVYASAICGISPILVVRYPSGDGGGSTVMYYAVVPTNASGAITFVRAATMGYGIMHAYSIKNLDSSVPVASSSLYGAGSLSLLARAGGVALSVTYHGVNDTTPSTITSNKQRTVAGGTGGGYSMNTFQLNPTAATTYSVSTAAFHTLAASWY